VGPNDGGNLPLGKGGERLFDWYFNGDTPIRAYQAAAERGVSVPPFKHSRSAEVFEALIASGGAVITGSRTYDITKGLGRQRPLARPRFSLSRTRSRTHPQGREPLHLRHRRRRQHHCAG
jgi:hypothetical protein